MRNYGVIFFELFQDLSGKEKKRKQNKCQEIAVKYLNNNYHLLIKNRKKELKEALKAKGVKIDDAVIQNDIGLYRNCTFRYLKGIVPTPGRLPKEKRRKEEKLPFPEKTGAWAKAKGAYRNNFIPNFQKLPKDNRKHSIKALNKISNFCRLIMT